MSSEQVEVSKKRKKKKFAPQSGNEVNASGIRDPSTTAAQENPADPSGFQLRDEFAESSALCTLPIADPGTQLCLLQLPLTWEADAHGTIQLPLHDGAVPGNCITSSGQEYHVLEEEAGPVAQIFAFAPGLAPPLAVQRYFTLVKAGNLDVTQLPPKDQAEVAKRPGGKKKAADEGDTEPPLSDSKAKKERKKDKRRESKNKTMGQPSTKKKQKKAAEHE